VAGLIGSIGGALLSAVVSPLGLIAAALGGGIFLWARYTESGKATVSTLSNLFGKLWDTFKNTFGGIKDALASGDLALAGKIGMTGLRIAWMQAWDTIATVIGGEAGDFIGGIAAKIGSGDLAGAWNDVVLGMSMLWDKFAGGIVSTFGNAAKAAVDAWQKATSAISRWILQMAAEGSPLARIVLGMKPGEFQKEMARSQKLRDQQIAIWEKRLADLRERQKNEDPLELGFAKGNDADIEKQIKDTEDNLAILRNQPTDILGDMQADAERQLKGTANAIQQWIDDAPNRATQSTDKFFDNIAGGSDRLKDAIAQAQKELEALRKEAEQNAKQQAKEQAATASRGLSMAGATSRGTFNAVNLLALQTASGGPEEETAKNTRKMRQLMERGFAIEGPAFR